MMNDKDLLKAVQALPTVHSVSYSPETDSISGELTPGDKFTVPITGTMQDTITTAHFIQRQAEMQQRSMHVEKVDEAVHADHAQFANRTHLAEISDKSKSITNDEAKEYVLQAIQDITSLNSMLPGDTVGNKILAVLRKIAHALEQIII